MYFIDVEGGQSTLIVTPAGESLLVDSGYAAQGRDSTRILAAMRDAGVTRIDQFLLTHFHADHMGGITELAGQVPIGVAYDHGELDANHGETPDAATVALYKKYVQALPAHHVEPRVGTRLPLKGVDEALWVSSDRQTIKVPMKGGGRPNASCPAEARRADTAENTRSTGFFLRFGSFRFVDLGDLTGEPLYRLICPKALLGPVDVFLVPHHANDDGTYPAVIAAFQPRAAIVNNGPAKGGQAAAFNNLHAALPLDGVWQLHRAEAAAVKNYPDRQIANLDTTTAYWLEVVARRDGSFSVSNPRTGDIRMYATP